MAKKVNTLEINQKKVMNTKKLLEDIISKPERFKDDVGLKESLRSQGGLAKYDSESRDIAPCALNTLKSASDLLLGRGFKELDDLRCAARDKQEQALLSQKPTTKTRTGLKHKVDELECQLGTLRNVSFLQGILIGELRSELKKMALSNEVPVHRLERYEEVNKTIEVKLSYVQSAFLG